MAFLAPVSAFLTPDGDIVSMAAAVNRLLDNLLLRMKMGEAIRQWAEKYYTIEKSKVNKLLFFYSAPRAFLINLSYNLFD